MEKKQTQKRLIDFRTYFYDKYQYPETAKKKLQLIIYLYKHYEIEVRPLLILSSVKNEQNKYIITYDDLPDREIIREALKIANPLTRAIILFESLSGCAKRETLNLTLGDFIQSLQEYTDSQDMYEIMQLLKYWGDIFLTFKLTRQKTGTYHYTFCSPEAIHAILMYLESENRSLTKPEFSLFKINPAVFTIRFGELNDKLKLGKRGYYNRFCSHMLRKFHAF